MIIAIETIRAVARRAAEDPAPGPRPVPAQPRRFRRPSPPSRESRPAPIAGLLPRLARLVTGMFDAGTPAGNVIYLIAQALAAFLPLLDLGQESPDADAAPEMTAKEEARIDLLRQERAARSGLRRLDESLIVKGRVRPDRPPAALRAADSPVTLPAVAPPDVWNDLLDLTSEALETFIRFRDAIGVKSCLELLDLLAETFAVDRPEAA